MNKIEKEFVLKGKAISRHGIILLSLFEAIDFVKECEQNAIGILGIDSFYLRSDTIQPSLDNSIDFTSVNTVFDKTVYEASLVFLWGKKVELYFEIICE